MYGAVGEADREVDELETAALGRALVELAHAESESPLVRELFSSVTRDLGELFEA